MSQRRALGSTRNISEFGRCAAKRFLLENLKNGGIGGQYLLFPPFNPARFLASSLASCRLDISYALHIGRGSGIELAASVTRTL